MLKPIVLAPLLLAASPSLAAVDLNVGINLSGDVQIVTTVYGCGEGTAPLTIKYINAAPNFFAIVPIEGEDVVFVNVISASGAKYVSGEYEWWNKGADASLHNVTEGLDAAPVLSCSENVQTP
jgi:membrane-bound inhibitor of C-type lysozyme